MNICGEKIILRAMDPDDTSLVHRWSNDPEIQEGLGGWHFPLSRTSIAKWIDSFQHDATDQRFMIEVPEAGPVGIVTLTSINWKDRNAFHGLLIGEHAQRRKGFAADAVFTIMRYAFAELGLQRLDTTIIEYNIASLALHINKCGWSEEGRKQQAIFRRNRFWANVLLGVTRDNHESRATG